jgi:hypothetical protein
MNPSTVPRNSGSDDVWRRRAARKLRNWLNDYLTQGDVLGSDRPLEEGAAQGAALSTSPLPAASGGEANPVFVASDRPQIEATGGPPEHWLQRVREGAPELLLSPQDGGPPFCSVEQPGVRRAHPMIERTPDPSRLGSTHPLSAAGNSDRLPTPPIGAKTVAVNSPGDVRENEITVSASRPRPRVLRKLLQPFARKRVSTIGQEVVFRAPSTIPQGIDAAAVDTISSETKCRAPNRLEPPAELEQHSSVASSPRRAKQGSEKASANRFPQPAATRLIHNPSAETAEFAGRRIAEPIPGVSTASTYPSPESSTTRPPQLPPSAAGFENYPDERCRPAPLSEQQSPPQHFTSRFQEGATQRDAQRSRDRFRGFAPASTYGESTAGDSGLMEAFGFPKVYASRTPSFPEFDGAAKPQWARAYIPANLPEITPDLWPELPVAPQLPFLDSQSAQRNSERSTRISSEQRGES